MIVILGASGFVGQRFQEYFTSAGIGFKAASRSTVDYYDRNALARFLRESEASFLINAAGFTGKPNVDACELQKADCLMANAVLPGRIAEACEIAGVPWGHVSSGCIYNGSKAEGVGFSEDDPPNFCFRSTRCSFYSGTKALGEEILDSTKCYIWRLRIPFDSNWNPRNYLVKLMTYEVLLDAENSLSHLEDFVIACYTCFSQNLPMGVYNLTNPGSIWTREIVDLLTGGLQLERKFNYFKNEEEFMQLAARTPRSNCLLDTTKQEKSALMIRPIEAALSEAISYLKLPVQNNQF